ncbi:hypothetical protein [Fimbriiglobus ruber]|uniref:DUF4198 domain-containing protein n=1 Tax=Fimbriiglobus ruber TaxID=1908690 RepID=A0A225D5C4_9BACT|nr:hypothetical protein [Fimbriiglobus ruber]OWK34824.1 hypothetical protein FRUB_09666 [Fimbriiglobus ruber]
MWTSLPLLAALALAPAQAAGTIDLTNVRNTYGEYGGPRPDAPVIPGDVIYVGFDIEGIVISPEGRVSYTMAMEVVDKTGKTFFKQDPAQKEDFVPLGGNKLPARAYVFVAPEHPAGSYTMKVTVTDNATKATKTLERKFEVLPKTFGVVGVRTSVDDVGQIAAPTAGVVGQSMFVQFFVTGFGRTGEKKQPNISVEMIPLDEQGKPTLQKPQPLNIVSGVDEGMPLVNVRFLLPLSRQGKFSIQLKATDNVTNKTNTFTLPITVYPSTP